MLSHQKKVSTCHATRGKGQGDLGWGGKVPLHTKSAHVSKHEEINKCYNTRRKLAHVLTQRRGNFTWVCSW